MKPVAITGMGAVSPFGYGIECLVDGMAAGTPPFVPIPQAEYKHCPGLYGALPANILPRGDTLLARANEFCLAGYWAAHQALHHSGYRPGTGYQCGLISASAFGYSVVDQFGDMLDFARAQYLYHASVNGVIAIKERVRGMQLMLTSLETAATLGIAMAAQMISSGRYEAVLAGGLEVYSRALYGCYGSVRKVAPLDCANPGAAVIAMRPWDPDRHGFVFSEGACYLMLEDLDKARARGATIWGLVVGWGSSQEASQDGYLIDERGGSLRAAVNQALSRAEVGHDAVSGIVCSANGSVQKDEVELRVLAERFAAASAAVEVTGFKGVLGETLGASGAFSTALACLAMTRTGRLPAVRGGREIRGSLRFAGGDQPVGRHLLITDLGYRGDGAALLLSRG